MQQKKPLTNWLKVESALYLISSILLGGYALIVAPFIIMPLSMFWGVTSIAVGALCSVACLVISVLGMIVAYLKPPFDTSLGNKAVPSLYAPKHFKEKFGLEEHPKLSQLHKSLRIRVPEMSDRENDNATPIASSITLVGDSTLDNSHWVNPAKRATTGERATNLPIYQHQGTDRDTPYHTLAELQARQPNSLRILFNLAGDGWITSEVVKGGRLDKVIGDEAITHPQGVCLQPLELAPGLSDHFNVPKDKRYYVISVGGNDFRERFLGFLLGKINKGELSLFQVATGTSPSAAVKKAIREKLDSIMEDIVDDYVKIIRTLRRKEPQAQIILSSQYFPDRSMVAQFIYKIYFAFGQIAKAYGYADANVALHQTLAKLYDQVFQRLNNENIQGVSFVDMTRSMPTTGFYTMQIEPNEKGSQRMGEVIAATIDSLERQPATNTIQYFHRTKQSNVVRQELQSVLENKQILVPSDLTLKPRHLTHQFGANKAMSRNCTIVPPRKKTLGRLMDASCLKNGAS